MACFSANTTIDSDKEVSCALCEKPYRDPRLLPCLHAFCFDCLQKELDDSTDRQASLLCPTCSEPIPLPIDELPRHVYLLNQANTVRRLHELKAVGRCENCNGEGEACAFCYDCGLRICERCVQCHKTFVVFREHTLVSLDGDLREFVSKENEKQATVCTKHGNAALK